MHIAIYGYSYLRTVKDERKRYNLAKTAKKLKIIPLGGVGEIGKNMTVIEYGSDIIIVDCGMSFPDEEMPGIDVVIPDMTYIEKNAANVRGILITRGALCPPKAQCAGIRHKANHSSHRAEADRDKGRPC